MATPDWSAIESLPRTPLNDLFAADANRLASLTTDVAGIHFDFSKTHLSPEALTAFEALADAAGFGTAREALFGGGIVNPTEGRAATHGALRGSGTPYTHPTIDRPHSFRNFFQECYPHVSPALHAAHGSLSASVERLPCCVTCHCTAR